MHTVRLPCTITNILWAAIKCTKDPMVRTYLLQAVYLKREASSRAYIQKQYPHLSDKDVQIRSEMLNVMRGFFIQLPNSVGILIGTTSRRLSATSGAAMYKVNVRVHAYGKRVINEKPISWTKLKKYLYPLRTERRWLNREQAISFAKARYNVDAHLGKWVNNVSLELAKYTDDETPGNILDLYKDFVLGHYNFTTLL